MFNWDMVKMYSISKNKGQFFSIITVFLVLPIITLSLTFSESIREYGSEIGSHMRLKSSYYYYYSIDEDLSRASKIIGERAVLSTVSHVVEKGSGLNSSEEALYELFNEGTIYGEHAPLMNRTGIGEWFQSVEKISERRGYNLNLTNKSLDISMYDPFHVSFQLNYSFKLEDAQDVFALKKERTTSNPVSIGGLEDPIVTLGTGGRFYIPIYECDFEYLTKKVATGTGNNSWSVGDTVVLPSDETLIEEVEEPEGKILVTEEKISEDILEYFSGVVIGEPVDNLTVTYVSDTDVAEFSNGTRVVVDGNAGEVWNIDNLYKMWEDSCYLPGTGPDFSARLENNLDKTSEYGLSVLLNKGELSAYGLEVKNRSNVAHVYFDDKDVTNCKVKGMPDSFLIDIENLANFGLDNTLSYNCE